LQQDKEQKKGTALYCRKQIDVHDEDQHAQRDPVLNQKRNVATPIATYQQSSSKDYLEVA
jgi:hypothetical protein